MDDRVRLVADGHKRVQLGSNFSKFMINGSHGEARMGLSLVAIPAARLAVNVISAGDEGEKEKKTCGAASCSASLESASATISRTRKNARIQLVSVMASQSPLVFSLTP